MIRSERRFYKLGEMTKGRRERTEKGSRERIEIERKQRKEKALK